MKLGREDCDWVPPPNTGSDNEEEDDELFVMYSGSDSKTD